MYYKDLLRYRNVWLGVALLWVILFHLPDPFNLGKLNFIKSFGYGGVDICLFASGIGCFYSLSSDSDILRFMKRRLKRLVPTYIIFIVVWLLYKYFIGQFNLQMALGNFLAVQNFTRKGNDFNWYISAILLFYILAPYFKSIAERASNVKKFLFLVFLLVFSIPFWNSNTYIITVTRLPVFYMGMLFADICKKDLKIRLSHIIGLAAACIIGWLSLFLFSKFFSDYLWGYGLYWYPFIFITPPLCIAISCVFMIIEKCRFTKPISDFLSLCGDYSFELYLIHIPLVSLIPRVIDHFNLIKAGYAVWLAGGIVLLIGCFVIRRLATWISVLTVKRH